MSAAAAAHGTTAHALADALRARILDGALAGGTRLVEQELCAAYAVARHTARAALRSLAAEGVVVIEPNRGARVARLGSREVRGLFELRTALEVEAVRLALERGDGVLPTAVDNAVERLSRVCEQRSPAWSRVVVAHERVHGALVAASASERLVRAHEALSAETRLFMVGLRPAWTLERMGSDHRRLPGRIERGGPDVLREHLAESAAAVVALID